MRRISGIKTFIASGICMLMLIPMMAVAQVAWIKNFDDALKQAAKEKKFIVLDISASW
jgi:hypothetical protein